MQQTFKYVSSFYNLSLFNVYNDIFSYSNRKDSNKQFTAIITNTSCIGKKEMINLAEIIVIFGTNYTFCCSNKKW